MIKSKFVHYTDVKTEVVIFIHIISQQISNECLQCMHWYHHKEDYKYYDYCLHVGGEERQTTSRKPKLDNYQANKIKKAEIKLDRVSCQMVS